jgi:hypothetical protein
LRVFAGCRDFSVPEARKHWRKNPEALRRVKMLVEDYKEQAKRRKA